MDTVAPHDDHIHGGHGHAHGRVPRTMRSKMRTRLGITLVLMVVYMVAEVVGGILSNSLALLADAGHMLSDAAAVLISLLAIWIAERPPTAERTYGYYRTEIMAALVNAVMLVGIAIFVFIEAADRFRIPPPVIGSTMMLIALGGLLTNLVCAWILSPGRGESLNARGVWLHVMMDALGSIGAIVSAALIWAFGWNWADPLASVTIGLLVIYSAWSLLRETVSVLMEAAPGHIDVDDVRLVIRQTPGVADVHDLHVWTVTSGFESLSAHVVATPGTSHQTILCSLRETLRSRFGIDHITIQIEDAEHEDAGACAASQACVRA